MMMRLAALTLSILLLTACAENPRVMSFESTSARDGAAWPVWPEEPEVPRFIYAGELSGEANFVEDKSDAETTGRDVFAWLVGLGRGEDRQPVVLQRPQGGRRRALAAGQAQHEGHGVALLRPVQGAGHRAAQGQGQQQGGAAAQEPGPHTVCSRSMAAGEVRSSLIDGSRTASTRQAEASAARTR